MDEFTETLELIDVEDEYFELFHPTSEYSFQTKLDVMDFEDSICGSEFDSNVQWVVDFILSPAPINVY